MNEIGNEFRQLRTSSSITLEEVSNDTGIPVVSLEQIEDGNIGSFKDIFVLKEYLQTYAKYLGLDDVKVIDNFNEYMFEYTSKIPIQDLAKAIETKEKEEEKVRQETCEIRVSSPYLSPKQDNKKYKMAITVIVIILLVAIALIWAIKQVM